jgi:hypothetical protein
MLTTYLGECRQLRSTTVLTPSAAVGNYCNFRFWLPLARLSGTSPCDSIRAIFNDD